jgi:PAS domain S-box-containing protein
MTLTRERLEQLVARSADIVVGTDLDGTVVYYNDGAKKSLGYAAEEVLGSSVVRVYPSREEAKRVMEAMRSPDYGGRGIVETFRTTFLSKGGERIPVAISGTILYDERGAEDGTIGFAKDLREILLKDQLATLGEVAVGLSHEISNPLAVILNQAELLQRDIVRLAGDRDVSVEEERLDAVRREISRISEILMRLGEMVREESYETIDYIGPTKMIDLRTEQRRGRAAEPELEGVRVLVVDDDLGICRSLREILESDGCKVEVAGDGVAALAALARLPFDVVLTDVVMPHMDGYELYTAIQERRPSLPVLMMTAFHYDKDHIIKRSRMAGLKTVIFKKPVDPDQLRRALIDAVGTRRSGAGADARAH